MVTNIETVGCLTHGINSVLDQACIGISAVKGSLLIKLSVDCRLVSNLKLLVDVVTKIIIKQLTDTVVEDLRLVTVVGVLISAVVAEAVKVVETKILVRTDAVSVVHFSVNVSLAEATNGETLEKEGVQDEVAEVKETVVYSDLYLHFLDQVCNLIGGNTDITDEPENLTKQVVSTSIKGFT